MATISSQKAEYLNLLNDIRLQETRAGLYLDAWARSTQDRDLKACLNFVAAREVSHGEIFERRVRELGGVLEEKEDQDFAERMRVVGSGMSDLEKINWLKEAQQRQPKPTVRERYEAAVKDESVDRLTRSLIRWFTDVEDDSRALMMETYAKVEARG